MFTGIVETIGTVKAWQQGGDTCQITIAIGSTWSDLHLGDSVAVNGVCLTAAALGEDWFRADVLVESLRRTSLAHLRPGAQVNLERALPVGGRLGGHFVTGHIDGVGRILSITKERNSLWYKIQLPMDVMYWLVPKGSIALDGTSLTIAELGPDWCIVSLIPHTASGTVLGDRVMGDVVNVEADVLGKYVRQFLQSGGSPGNSNSTATKELSMDMLQEHGFFG